MRNRTNIILTIMCAVGTLAWLSGHLIIASKDYLLREITLGNYYSHQADSVEYEDPLQPKIRVSTYLKSDTTRDGSKVIVIRKKEIVYGN